jgi:spore coat polysaccharide biosynthesis protein SpsF
MMALAILQARMSSTRLPGKVMRPLLGQPMIARQIERVRRASRLSGLVVATSDRPGDDILADWCAAASVDCFRGDLDDVLARFLGALAAKGWPEQCVRLTADCPLADPELIDRAIGEHIESGADYTHVQSRWTFPKGLDVEVFRTGVLREVGRIATGADREHVTRYIYTHPDRFRIHAIDRDPPLRYRWTVDTPEDFAFVEAIYAALYPAKPAFTSDDILDWQTHHPDRVLVNTEV